MKKLSKIHAIFGNLENESIDCLTTITCTLIDPVMHQRIPTYQESVSSSFYISLISIR